MKKPVERKRANDRPVKCALCIAKECHTNGMDCFAGRGDRTSFLDEEDRKLLKCASEIEGEFYFKMTRLEELIEFAGRMGFARLGIAFCVGLEQEARILHKILAKHFTVSSVCCKACGIDKKRLNLKQIKEDRFETMCNPVGQAALLASEDTQLNIIVGLCIGHDILFTRHSKAPVTTLIVKDRVLAHNPAGALYSGYYRKNRFNLGGERPDGN